MTRDIIDFNDFTVLVEEAFTDKPVIDACSFDEPAIGVAFYGSGDVDVTVRHPEGENVYKHTKGLALSFYADENVVFEHKVLADKPLQCIVIATATRNIKNIPDGEIFSEFLNKLVHPNQGYVEGPRFLMGPEMMDCLEKVFNIRYEGKTRMMFFRSQMNTLLSYFFGFLSNMKEERINEGVREKLIHASEILLENLEDPPSLNELSKSIGLNTYKLKKDFKELFGVPVFKYLQNQRMSKAHELLLNADVTIQEAAWQVGYDSLSSFSNAFADKFGFRPSQVRK